MRISDLTYWNECVWIWVKDMKQVVFYVCFLRFSSLCNHNDLNGTQRYATQHSTISLFLGENYLLLNFHRYNQVILCWMWNAMHSLWVGTFGILSYDWDLLNLVVSYGCCFVSHFLMLFVLLNLLEWSQWITPHHNRLFVCLISFFDSKIFIALNHFQGECNSL